MSLAVANGTIFAGKQKGDKGLYIEPTMFGDIKDDMCIATEEIFGPVLCCMKWQSLDEVSAHYVSVAAFMVMLFKPSSGRC